MHIYCIGGSPCSGKSTVAQALAIKHGLQYFKVDDHLDRYMKQGAADGKEACAHSAAMSPEEIWMRDPLVQCQEELRIYEEIFPYVLADWNAIQSEKGIITEGAAYLPALMQAQGFPADHYLALTPTKAFQVSHYEKREWVPYVLADCSDKARAFANWMERDALFAKAVQQQCGELGYVSLINDGSMAVDRLMGMVENHFGLAQNAQNVMRKS
ncbi:MAG: hypothetical protein IKC28_02195 [Clostridia bacterium]|nr:hypothetical protein [Clostridia bacterium]